MALNRPKYFFIFALAAVLFFPAGKFCGMVLAEEPIITAIIITVPDDFEGAPELTRMARDLLFLKEGIPFSPTALEHSLRALRLSHRFSHIDVESREEGNTFELIFNLTPAPLVRDIRMTGIYPFFERDIRNVMTLSPGNTVTASDLEEQGLEIEKFYRQEGFIDPDVTVETVGDPREGFLSLRISVTKGPFYRLDEISISGASHFSESALRNAMKVHRYHFLPGVAGRFLEQRLSEDITVMVRRYRKAGFADCFIDSEITRNRDSGLVSLKITVQEGPRYGIEFSGNQAFRDGALKDELLFVQLGNRNNVALNRSVRAITQRYRTGGYPDMTLALEDETFMDQEQLTRKITFIIDEGLYYETKSLAIEGLTAVPERTLRSWLDFAPGRPFAAEQIDQGIFIIESALKALGYLDVAVHSDIVWQDEDDRRSAHLVLTIEEGTRTTVSGISFTGLDSLSYEEARQAMSLKEGDTLVSQILEQGRRNLAAVISEKGRPHVEVRELLHFGDDLSTVNVEFRVQEGPSVVMGNVYLRGNFRTKDRILLRQLKLNPGDPFSASRFLEGERSVRDLDILESSRFRAVGLAEGAGEITLLMDVAEKKPYFIEAGFGYESQRGLYADAKAGDRNLFGVNRSGWIGSSVSETGYRNEATINDPRFLGYSLSATLGLYQERTELFNQDFGTDTYGAALRFSRKLGPNLSAGLGFRFEQKELFLREGTTNPGDEDIYLARSIFVTSSSLTYDTRDFFMRPRSGVFIILAVDVSKGIRNSFDDFFKYSLDVRYFRTPLPRVTLALMGRGAYLQSFGSSGTIPDDQLLFLGGTASVRGFAENMLRYGADGKPLGGRVALSGNVEARIDLGGNWELTTFFDTGSVSRTFDDFGTDGFRSSLGAGLRYITPIGPLGILYGRKLDRRDGEGADRWHLSIGYTF